MRDFDWTVLVTLYKTKSISKTAEQLFISQPALTKRIQAIERELGLTLVTRTRQGCRFTQDGEQIVKKAEIVAGAIQAVYDDARARSHGKRGILRLGVPFSYSRYVLPALLDEYSKRFQCEEVDITIGMSTNLVRMVEEDVLDLCLARYESEDTPLERVLLCSDPMRAVFSRPFLMEELPELPYIEFSHNPLTMALIHRWWSENFSQQPSTRFKVNSGDACLSMIKRGLGYSIFPDPKLCLNEPELYTIPLTHADGSPIARRTWLIYRSESKNRPPVSSFLRFMEDLDLNALC